MLSTSYSVIVFSFVYSENSSSLTSTYSLFFSICESIR